MKKLSPVTYAILGQLALRTSSGYALIAEMQRNFHYFYPHAESGLYAEIKHLAELGLVRMEKEYQGKRARSVYSITDKGREALQEWLATPPQPFILEFEGLVRLLFGDFMSHEQLLNTIAKVEKDAQELIIAGSSIREEYLGGTAPFQEQVHLRAFVFDFLWSYGHMMHDWANRTRGEIELWEAKSLEERRTRGLQIIEKDAE